MSVAFCTNMLADPNATAAPTAPAPTLAPAAAARADDLEITLRCTGAAAAAFNAVRTLRPRSTAAAQSDSAHLACRGTLLACRNGPLARNAQPKRRTAPPPLAHAAVGDGVAPCD